MQASSVSGVDSVAPALDSLFLRSGMQHLQKPAILPGALVVRIWVLFCAATSISRAEFKAEFFAGQLSFERLAIHEESQTIPATLCIE